MGETTSYECRVCGSEIVVDEQGRVVGGDVAKNAPTHLLVCSNRCLTKHRKQEVERVLNEMTNE